MKKVIKFASVMLISIFVCGCSKGKSVSVEPDALTDSVSTAGETETDEEELSGSTKNIEAIMRSIANGDAKKLASLTAYPIMRPYPLEDIEDSAQIVAYFNTMFDAPIREKLRKATVDDWEAVGAKGYLFDNGSLWIHDSLIAVNYVSKKEQQMINEGSKKEEATLHASLRGEGWKFMSCYLGEDGTLFRLDQKLKGKSNNYRLTVFPKGVKAGNKPQLLLMGEVGAGSAYEQNYSFTDGRGNSISFCKSIDEESVIMEIVKDGKEYSVQTVPCRWLDVVK